MWPPEYISRKSRGMSGNACDGETLHLASCEEAAGEGDHKMSPRVLQHITASCPVAASAVSRCERASSDRCRILPARCERCRALRAASGRAPGLARAPADGHRPRADPEPRRRGGRPVPVAGGAAALRAAAALPQLPDRPADPEAENRADQP